ncbi:hypothetical protein GCM10028803_01010 [Larkinella knui]
MDYPGSVHNFLIEWMTFTRLSHKIYFILKIGFAAGLFFLATRKNPTRKQQTGLLILALLAVFSLRLPNLVLPEQNLDESFMITGAGTMLNKPLVFKSFDGTTIGPIHYYLLALSYWLMGPLNYTSVRILGLLFSILPSIFLIYRSIRLLYNQEIASIVVFGYTLCMAGITFFEFIAYSSEVLPHLIILIELLCLSAILAGRKFVYAGFLCFAAGLMPYAKLQGVPIAGLIVVFLFIERARELTVKRAVLLGVLGLVPSIGVGLYLYFTDLFPDFYASYILYNLNYSSSSSNLNWTLPVKMVFGNADMPRMASDILPFFLFTFFCILGLGTRLLVSQAPMASKRRVIYAFLLVGVAWFSVIKPGHGFQHYLFFFFAPLFWGLGVVCGENQQLVTTSRYKYALFVPFLLFFLLPILERNKGIEYAYRPRERPDPLVSVIKSMAKPTDRISIWGHGNLAHVYCHTGLLPGTRDVFASRQIYPSTLQPYFIRRYIDDLHRNRPRFILEDIRNEKNKTRLQAIDARFMADYRVHSILDSVKVYVRQE